MQLKQVFGEGMVSPGFSQAEPRLKKADKQTAIVIHTSFGENIFVSRKKRLVINELSVQAMVSLANLEFTEYIGRLGLIFIYEYLYI